MNRGRYLRWKSQRKLNYNLKKRGISKEAYLADKRKRYLKYYKTTNEIFNGRLWRFC